MKIKQFILIPLMSFAVTSYAASALFQAGNIFQGQIVSINKDSGLASYYADGKSGQIEFSCILTGDAPEALLTPGKNFLNEYNPIAIPLNKDTNSLKFIWTLTDKKEDNGNIKVRYLDGQNVTVQCSGIAVIKR